MGRRFVSRFLIRGELHFPLSRRLQEEENPYEEKERRRSKTTPMARFLAGMSSNNVSGIFFLFFFKYTYSR